MTTTCKVCHRKRYIKAAGMCRTCREKHLSKQMRPIGDSKKRILELIEHYGNLGATARHVGLARNTADRIRRADVDSRITRTAYNAIMNHQPTGQKMPEQKRPDPITGPEVAAYAQTAEGLAFIQRCKRPAAYRIRNAA